MRTDPMLRRFVNGPTMGTRYAAVFFAPAALDLPGLHRALQDAVDRVDAQMSTWKPDSDLMRLNRAPVGTWFDLQPELSTVLSAALEIGWQSDGAFDIGVGDLVTAWGFGPAAGVPDPRAIEAATRRHEPAHCVLELDPAGHRVRKLAPIGLDLSGIAKGFGVDELAHVLEAHGIASYLVSIDGELRAGAPKPDGSPWYVALESPEFGYRRAAGFVELADAALATSGDYRHVVEHEGVRHAHTIDPQRNAPLANGPAAVTVRAPTCVAADAWATAFMVIGPERGSALATSLGLDVLFAEREPKPLTEVLPSP